MKPLTLDDLLPLAEFAGRRSEFFAAHSRYLDRYRRVRVGPRLTFVFENRQTLWFRIHELLRVARLAEPVRVRQELDWYNELLPGRDTLQAALFIDVSGDGSWTEQLEYWADLAGEHLRLVVDKLSVPAELVTCRPEDRCTGAAQWVRVAVAGGIRAALADSRLPAWIAVDYREYRHRSQLLSAAMRSSLLGDLEPSNRRAA
ncbi:MAG TPA: DUF3501 family protein [Gemmataceae bacterium]|nr:DUF3501 family protein [Gemmataceae bacterium]